MDIGHIELRHCLVESILCIHALLPHLFILQVQILSLLVSLVQLFPLLVDLLLQGCYDHVLLLLLLQQISPQLSKTIDLRYLLNNSLLQFVSHLQSLRMLHLLL